MGSLQRVAYHSNYFARVRRWLKAQLELSRGGNAQNIRAMEGLRGFAALMVFLYHYLHFAGPHLEHAPVFASILSRISQLGNAGVDLFFVLSGYLIYGSLISKARPFSHYMSRRIARIYPVFTAMFLLYVALSYAMPDVNRIPPSLPDALAYLTASFFLLGPLMVPVWPLIPVAWSLSYEIFSYAMIPLLIGGFRLRKRSPLRRIAFFLVLAGAYFTFCVLFTGQSRVLMFVAGIILYETLTHTRTRAPALFPTLLTCIICFTLYVLLFDGRNDVPLNTLLLSTAFFVLCFHCFASQQTWLKCFFEWTPLRWFGNMSYSFYMTHILSMRIFALLLPSSSFTFLASAPLIYFAFLPLFFVAALLPAFVVFMLIERPFSLKKTLSRSPSQTPAMPGTPNLPPRLQKQSLGLTPLTPRTLSQLQKYGSYREGTQAKPSGAEHKL